jgi:hypothetical protein
MLCTPYQYYSGDQRMKLAGHVTHMGRDVHRGFWWKKLREGDHLENPGVDGRIIL